MDMNKLALKVAQDLIAADPEEILKNLKYIEVTYAEGDIKTGLPIIKGKKYNSVLDFEKRLSKFKKPDKGYDKVGILLVFKDGSQLKSFRYDHGKKDPSFTKQLEWYIKNNVTIGNDKVPMHIQKLYGIAAEALTNLDKALRTEKTMNKNIIEKSLKKIADAMDDLNDVDEDWEY